jgi:hypothetical protein
MAELTHTNPVDTKPISRVVRDMDGPLIRRQNQLRMLRLAVLGMPHDPYADVEGLSTGAISDELFAAERLLTGIMQDWQWCFDVTKPAEGEVGVSSAPTR